MQARPFRNGALPVQCLSFLHVYPCNSMSFQFFFSVARVLLSHCHPFQHARQHKCHQLTVFGGTGVWCGGITSRCPRWLSAHCTGHVTARSRDTFARLFRGLKLRGVVLPLPGLRPIPVPPDTTLDQVLVHWHDSPLDVLGVPVWFWDSSGRLTTSCRTLWLWFSSEHTTLACLERHKLANQHRLVWSAVTAGGPTLSGVLPPH